MLVAVASGVGGVLVGWTLHACALARRRFDSFEDDHHDGESECDDAAPHTPEDRPPDSSPDLEPEDDGVRQQTSGRRTSPLQLDDDTITQANAKPRLRQVTGGEPLSPLYHLFMDGAKDSSSGSPLRRSHEVERAEGGNASDSALSASGLAKPPTAALESAQAKQRRPRRKTHKSRVYGLGGYSQSSRVMLCMVGLPARGKSYITKMLQRYLQWSGFPVRIFNAGNIRRQEGLAGAAASFFKDDNKDAACMREKVASECMEEAIKWLSMQTNVCVAIFDATNTTKTRRKAIVARCRENRGITPVFIESICDNAAVLEENYKLKMGNEDYSGMDPEKARADFIERVKNYERRYETIEENEQEGELTFIKLFNVGQKVIMHHCSGYLVSQIGFYLSNIHIQPRRIWLTQHAQAEDEGVHKGELTDRGKAYCSELYSWLVAQRAAMKEAGEGEGAEMLVLMGTAPVHAATFEHMSLGSRWTGGFVADEAVLSQDNIVPQRSVSCSSYDSLANTNEFPAMSTSLLNEMDRGDYASVSYSRIQSDFPEIWAERQRDPLYFRYPGTGAESYADVVGRLRPIIIELERQRRSVLVISHLAVSRCLYGYFTGSPMEDLPNLSVDVHTIVELQPGPFGCKVQASCLDPDGPPPQ